MYIFSKYSYRSVKIYLYIYISSEGTHKSLQNTEKCIKLLKNAKYV